MASLSGVTTQVTQAAQIAAKQTVSTVPPAATVAAVTPITIPEPATATASVPLVAIPTPQVMVSANNPFIARDLDFATDWISMLIYGDFGVGKTYMAGTAALVPEYTDVLYIALEGGEKGLKQLIRLGKQNGIDIGASILVIPVQTFKQYANIYEFLKIHVKLRDADDIINLRRLEAQIKGYSEVICKDDAQLALLIPKPKKLRTVITDSLTEAQKYCMYQLLGIDPLKQRIDQEPDQAQFAEWGRSREMIQFLVRRLRDLPIHSLFICGQDTDQDAAKIWYYTPLLPGKLAGDVRGLVDCVGYMCTIPQEGGQVTRRMFFVGGKYGNSHIAAKHRFGSNLKGSFVDNPTMQTIYDLDMS